MADSLFVKLESADTGSIHQLSDCLDALSYNPQGLVPVIAQDANSKQVLMMAWMNRAALDETLATGRVCYFSRSRDQLWRKGESSGHVQMLVSAHIDCDGDTLLLQVEQTGPACHTNRANCFYLEIDQQQLVVTRSPE